MIDLVSQYNYFLSLCRFRHSKYVHTIPTSKMLNHKSVYFKPFDRVGILVGDCTLLIILFLPTQRLASIFLTSQCIFFSSKKGRFTKNVSSSRPWTRLLFFNLWYIFRKYTHLKTYSAFWCTHSALQYLDMRLSKLVLYLGSWVARNMTMDQDPILTYWWSETRDWGSHNCYKPPLTLLQGVSTE